MNDGKGHEKCPPLVFFNTLGVGINSGLDAGRNLSRLRFPLLHCGQFFADSLYLIENKVLSFL